MNSPYMGNFQVTQEFKGSAHDGFDLVGLDSKEIHATISGKVVHAGWENPNDHSQGFGQFVCILGTDGNYYYYGHMSKVIASYGDEVKCTDVIGIEGNTGYSFGSHCHYCVRPRFAAGCFLDVTQISGIPNALGVYNDGYDPNAPQDETPAITVTPTNTDEDNIVGTHEVTINGKEYIVEIKRK